MKTNIKKISELGIALALAVILSYLRVYQMPQGGSVSLEMVPIFLLALRWGWKDGIFLGFTYGVMQILLKGNNVYHLLQGILDYPVAFAVLGLAGLFNTKIKNKFFVVLAVLLGGGLRFIAHILSGVVFFGAYAPEGSNPWMYSISYNSTYMIPEIIISILVTLFLLKGLSEDFFVVEGVKAVDNE
ncbi:energy-coupled thiamine transporter ThiT [Halonatronum saccharophilum]|uniref:energy-coupled thiamine transporter ThiT n=1 Tax=Halonatronum saccharophilum TaxID=150060 RepID=UPI0004B4CFF5|nr:energy-coupled thiamine transporter ThiT [Halonatronum saccharophilum]